MKYLIFNLLAVTALAGAPAKRAFVGVITDDNCPNSDHSQMRMGSTDAECTIACVDSHGAMYLLYDGKNSYTLSDQQTPKKFAGQKVTVLGTLDSNARKVQVDSIIAAK